jgi:hypothetical protein
MGRQQHPWCRCALAAAPCTHSRTRSSYPHPLTHPPQALADLREGTQGLPEQISVELHFTGLGSGIPEVAARNQVQMSLFFLHMANLGYGVISREDNMFGSSGCCSEYSFLRVEANLLGQRLAP